MALAPLTRRSLFHSAAALTASSALARLAHATPPAPAVDPLTQHLSAATDPAPRTPPSPRPPGERIGFAVVGLGHLAMEEILPAFGACENARLAAVVSGHAAKAQDVARRYGLANTAVYDYASFDRLRDNPDVQVVYVVLPNSMHREFTERAAVAGKHVLCEKPMAPSVTDCDAMIAACEHAGKKLMIAYRQQYEPFNRALVQMVRSNAFGALKSITADNTQAQGDPTQWRLQRALSGGGCLPDVGIYCLNAARFITGEEPVEVFARMHSTPNDPRFREVEEQMNFVLRFPSGVLANCSTSYGAHNTKRLAVMAETASVLFDPAFSYRGLRMHIARRGDNGGPERTEDVHLAEKNQFATEMDHMADCVRTNRTPHTPGEEGRQDVRIMEALYRSAQGASAVTLPPVNARDAFRGPQPAPA